MRENRLAGGGNECKEEKKMRGGKQEKAETDEGEEKTKRKVCKREGK